MKRSQIDSSIEGAIRLLAENNITLPFFGYLTAGEWKKAAAETDMTNVREMMLGWDVTDFGSGDFDRCGCVLFTARNGNLNGAGTPYAEKYLVFNGRGQEIPLHYHMTKTEDIINRAGGLLCVTVYNSKPDAALDTESDVEYYSDGVKHTVKAGSTIEIPRGCSITLTPYMFHSIHAKIGLGALIAGEVSRVNDDRIDNVFAEKTDRFCGIDEDEEARYLLVNELV